LEAVSRVIQAALNPLVMAPNLKSLAFSGTRFASLSARKKPCEQAHQAHFDYTERMFKIKNS
jgi:hypothetical protein